MKLFRWDVISHKRFSKYFNCGPWVLGCWSSMWWIADVCFFLLFWRRLFSTSCTLFLPCSLPKAVFQNGGISAVETRLWTGTHRGLSCWATPTQATKFTSQNLHRLWSLSRDIYYLDVSNLICFAAFFIFLLCAVTLVSFYVKIFIAFIPKPHCSSLLLS